MLKLRRAMQEFDLLVESQLCALREAPAWMPPSAWQTAQSLPPRRKLLITFLAGAEAVAPTPIRIRQVASH
jgi:hypothetical protein